MKSLSVSRTCPTCGWGMRSEIGQMPEPADVTALVTEVGKDLAAELGVAPDLLTPEHRAHVRNLVRQRFFAPSVDGTRGEVLTPARATQMQTDMNVQGDAALLVHRRAAHGAA